MSALAPGKDTPLVADELSLLRERLRLLEERERFLLRVDEDLRVLGDPAAITLRAASLLGEHLRANRCAYAYVDTDQDTFHLTGNYFNGTDSMVGTFRFSQFGQAVLHKMRAGEPFVVPDSELEVEIQPSLEIYRATSIRSVICCPVLKAGVFCAAMAVHTNAPRSWQPEEVELARAVASRCWESIERTRAIRHLEVSKEELARSEAELRLITDALPSYVAYIDRNLRYRRVNLAYLQRFGRTEDQIVGRTAEDVLGTSYPSIAQHLESALGGIPQHFETAVKTVQGTRVLSVSHIPDTDVQGHIRGVIVQGHDITDRRGEEETLRRSQAQLKQAVSSLQASEDRYRALAVEAERQWAELETIYQTAPIGLALFELKEYRYLRLNDRQAAFFGLSPGQVVGRTLTEMAPIAGLKELFDQVRAGEPVVNFQLEGSLITDPEQHRYWTVSYFPVLGADGNVCAITAATLEITQQKKAELALIQTEKLAAVGRLAASIAHEINNPLEAVTNLLYLARNNLEMSDVQHYLDLAERELRRVSIISNQTLRFHKQSTKPMPVATTDLFESVLSIYQGRIVNSRVDVQRRDSKSRPIECFDGEIRQVLNNLVGNAIDAMHPAGGKLLLRSREGHCWTTGRPGVIITVADTGAGMSAQTKQRIFEPFYTTKGIGGTGLGLWVSQEIVTRHQGSLRVRSRQGDRNRGVGDKAKSGTVFVLFLPHKAIVQQS